MITDDKIELKRIKVLIDKLQFKQFDIVCVGKTNELWVFICDVNLQKICVCTRQKHNSPRKKKITNM